MPFCVALHCNFQIAALLANPASTVLPDELEEQITNVWYYFPKYSKQLQVRVSSLDINPYKLLKACKS